MSVRKHSKIRAAAAIRKKPAAAATTSPPPTLLTYSIEQVVLSTFRSVDINESSLEILAEQCEWLAEYVATVFWARREGFDQRWQDYDRQARQQALQEELLRESRGDYE